MQDFIVNELANDALNAACLHIQEQLGVSTGDLAGQFFSGDVQDHVLAILAAYIRAEINLKAVR